MKARITTILLLLSAMFTLQAQNTPGIIPYPKEITIEEGFFTLKKGAAIATDTPDQFLTGYLTEHLNTLFNFKTTLSKDGNIKFKTDQDIENEAYRLHITTKDITIEASGHAGFFYGIQTLLQMLPSQVYGTQSQRLDRYALPLTKIEDSPRFPYRGFMLDVSRTFFDIQYIKNYLDWMSYHKLNTFQWNLADDNGWRIEIKKYPLLTQKGAWRGKEEILPPTYNSGAARYGGFYTQKEIKEIIEYASRRNITIIPEIDLPGHSRSAVACYPEIGCGTTTGTASACGEFDNVWCVGREENYKMLNNIIKEVAQLFPGPYINIGGDEVILDYWAQCPECQALMKKEGMTDTYQLMGYFVKKMETIIESHGKKMIGWDDIQDNGGLHPETAVVAWRNFDKAKESTSKGHPTVMQIAAYCYVDMQYTPAERGHAWAAIIPLDRIYNFDPVKNLGLTPEQEKLILGTQAGLFTELMIFPPRFSEYQVFPRLTALAEVAWSDTLHRCYTDFHNRLAEKHYDRLHSMGIAFRVEPPAVTYDSPALRVTLPYPSAEVRYTTDGTEPTNTDPVYQGQIITDHPENFRFSTFFGRDLHSIAVAADNIQTHRYLTPEVTIETDIEFIDKTPISNITGYDFQKLIRTKTRVQKGQHLTYIFTNPVECSTITIPTGYTNIPFYGVSDGYIEYSHDGTSFIRGEDFYHYQASIKNITKPIKAIRIIITDTNDGWQCNFQNLKIE